MRIAKQVYRRELRAVSNTEKSQGKKHGEQFQCEQGGGEGKVGCSQNKSRSWVGAGQAPGNLIKASNSALRVNGNFFFFFFF